MRGERVALEPDVHRNDEGHRFELWEDGERAGFAVFHDRGGRRIFVHTEIDDAFSGRGLGGALARGALDQTRREGLPIVPLCPFIAGWIERHDDYADMVDRETSAALGL